METKKIFKVGKRYCMRSICDSECIWTYEVISRTASTVVMEQIRSNGERLGAQSRFRINKQLTELRNAETVYPTGHYSMAPTLSADNEVPADIKTYGEVKEKYPDAILLFRNDFTYDVYRDDAVTCADVLDEELMSLWGNYHVAFAHKFLDIYLPKLVAKGYRVAIIGANGK